MTQVVPCVANSATLPPKQTDTQPARKKGGVEVGIITLK